MYRDGIGIYVGCENVHGKGMGCRNTYENVYVGRENVPVRYL